MMAEWTACLAYWAEERARGARLCEDSRFIEPGDVFVAYPGHQVDGRRFIAEALQKGAAGIIMEPGEGLTWPSSTSLKSWMCADCRRHIASLAYAWYDVPAEHMTLVAVTGTNGKTSFCHWLAQLLTALGARPAVIGTVGAGYAGDWHKATLTTPKPIDLARLLRDFDRQGCSHVIFEASSIGLAEHRLDGLRIDAAALTNCTQDHLDYHGDMTAYASAKARLFEMPSVQCVALNIGDVLGQRLAQSLRGASVCVYDTAPIDAAQYERFIAAEVKDCTMAGVRCVLQTEARRYEARLPVMGVFNVQNLLAVMSLLRLYDIDLSDMLLASMHIQPVCGRMEPIRATDDHALLPQVYVDYAHTPDALRVVLSFLRQVTVGRVYLVLGAGGERDQQKRPLMGAVAAHYADHLIVTNDNPRREPPERIVADIVAGLGPDVSYEVCMDRAAAIRRAVHAAGPDDVVCITGKGHEEVQVMADGCYAFSDQSVARAALEERKAQHG